MDLSQISGQTITVTIGTLELDSNFQFNGANVTVQQTGAVGFGLFVVDSANSVSFSTMTLQGGVSGKGGAILVGNNANVQVDTCSLENNTASGVGLNGFGGALYASSGSSLWINNTTLSGNTADVGGGAIYATGAASLTIHDSTISGNSAIGAVADGGGLYIANTFSTRIDQSTTITGNGATMFGGGVYLSNSVMTVADPIFEMDGGQLFNNLAGGNGGGIYVNVKSTDVVTLDNVSVTQNNTGGKGGGAYILQGLLSGSLTALIGNGAAGGIPGIAYKTGAPVPTITIPPGQQTIQLDP